MFAYIRRRTIPFGVQLVHRVDQHALLTQSAALAYYTAFSLVPLVILFLSFLASLHLSLQKELLAQVHDLVGSEAAGVLSTVINNARDQIDLSSIADWGGVVTLLLASSGVFGQLQGALNVIFKSQPKTPESRGWLSDVWFLARRRLISFGIVLAFLFVLIVSLLVSSLLSITFLFNNEFTAHGLNTALSLLVFSGLFAFIFKWVPDGRIAWPVALRGGAVTSVLFVLGKALIGLYLGQTAVGSAYGAAGSLVVLLAWVYYSSFVVLLGAEISTLVWVKTS